MPIRWETCTRQPRHLRARRKGPMSVTAVTVQQPQRRAPTCTTSTSCPRSRSIQSRQNLHDIGASRLTAAPIVHHKQHPLLSAIPEFLQPLLHLAVLQLRLHNRPKIGHAIVFPVSLKLEKPARPTSGAVAIHRYRPQSMASNRHAPSLAEEVQRDPLPLMVCCRRWIWTVLL